MERTTARLFALFLLPRLIAGIVFSLLGYVGSGGDAATYNIVGLYARDLWVDPQNASLDVIIDKWWTDEKESVTGKYSSQIFDAESGTAGLFVSSTAPIIGLHAALYVVWRHPFIFVLFVCLLQAAIYTTVAKRLELSPRFTTILALNPVSIYFAATHYKESISEALVVAIVAALSMTPTYVTAVLFSIALAAFRIDFIPFILILWLRNLFSKIDSRMIIVGIMFLFAIMPSLYWQLSDAPGGPIYSLVNSSVFTKRTLGPLVGLIMPLPFVESVLSPFGAFLTIYALTYWYFFPFVITYVLFFKKPNASATAVILIGLCISYYVIGGMAAKARFFAPFIPLLILAFIEVRTSVVKWLAPKLRRANANACPHQQTIPKL